MSISYIVRGSLLACLASAMMGTTYPEWTAANVGDDVTLSWSLPQSLIGSGFRIFAVKLNAGTNDTKHIMSVIMNGGKVTLKSDENRTPKYAGNISTTGVFSLWLKNVQEEDAGRYSCEKPKDNYGHGLVVLQPPSTPNISISSNSTVPGQPVTLKCSSSSQSLPSGHPSILSYTWKMNGTDLQQEHGPNLTLHNVTRHDKVVYSCQTIEAMEDKEIRSNWSRQLRLSALGPPGSPVAFIAAGTCSILFVFVAVIFVIGLKRCRLGKEQRQRRFAHYLTPVRSQQGDDADYASINIEDVSVESTSDTKNDYQDLQPSQHHHIYTAMYPQEGNRRQRCGVVCGCLSVQCTM